MSTLAEVRLWGRTIGAVVLEDGDSVASFEYDPRFARSGIQVSPLHMPLPGTRRRIFRFSDLSRQTFHGLPGLLSDSLPDRFGHALIDAWLAANGRAPDSLNAVERLCYVGRRGMGALEFEPVIGPRATRPQRVDIEQLVKLASEVLTRRVNFETSLEQRDSGGLRDILRLGTSAGGARAKAVIAWNRETGDVRSGQLDVDPGYEHWLLKFDGVSGNRDRELADPRGYGLVEYAYHLMARDAGIEMSEGRLLEEGGRRHFMTRRFDRTAEGGRLHMQSLCALVHYDYNAAGAYSYEQALQVIRQLGLPMEAVEEQFRRMAFNIVARNQDDHTKNIAFLMDRGGNWSLSPAFDLTYSHNPEGAWTSTHQMSLNGKRDGFARDDFRQCARLVSMQRGRADRILDEVLETVSRWPEYAKEAGVPRDWRHAIRKQHRLDLE